MAKKERCTKGEKKETKLATCCIPQHRLCNTTNRACCSEKIRHMEGHILVCTRSKGHTGPHIACGHIDHNLARSETAVPKREAQFIVLETQCNTVNPLDIGGAEVHGPFGSIEQAKAWIKKDAEDCYDPFTESGDCDPEKWGSNYVICQVVKISKPVPTPVPVKVNMVIKDQGCVSLANKQEKHG